MVGGDGCCGQTGGYGLALIIIAAFVNLALGVGCIVAGILMFILKKDYGQAIRIIYLVGLILAGIFIAACMVIVLIAFTISPDGRSAAIACFVIAFFFELIIFIILLVAFLGHWQRGDTFNVNLVGVFVVPIGMAFCVLGVLLLLIEWGKLGQTALTGIIIAAIVVSFIFFICLIVALVFLVIQTVRGSNALHRWVIIILLVFAALIDLAGVICAACVAADLIAAAIGFILIVIVTGTLVAVAILYWFLSARRSEQLAYKWSIFALGCIGAFFFAIALIGLLCVGGLWVLHIGPGL
eukprot:TRINITY_DN23068_c0_g1_i1.p1 TRINITY_DN23068_c0_g1~~TRINITY_DN23068_c0_g1_i1.p1  ORF type:complete len:296 (-),score=17.27 TRINITY_DN23068_c0_g1_i1:66-953(-)